jgi:hypothetical protein
VVGVATAQVGILVRRPRAGVGPPAFASGTQATFSRGVAGSFSVVTGGTPPAAVAVSAGALPAGLQLVDRRDGTAAISGTPTGPGGSTAVELTATNAAGVTSQVLTITIDAPPAFTTARQALFTVGVAGSFQVRTSGQPVGSLVIQNQLPAGLTWLDQGDGTGVIAGTPVTAGAVDVGFIAHNRVGESYQRVRLVVQEAPAFVSGADLRFAEGLPARFLVRTTGTPAPRIAMTAGALPRGLSLVDYGNGTATITGTPEVSGAVTVMITAASRAGSGTQTVTITVIGPPKLPRTASAAFAVGRPGGVLIAAEGYPRPALRAVSALPAGLRITDHGDGTATITGIPDGPGGRTSVEITATSPMGVATQVVEVLVTEPPDIADTTPRPFVRGQEGSQVLRVGGYPVPRLAATGLPAGLTLTDQGDGTATLAGTPVGSAGTAGVRLIAVSRAGTDVRTLPLVVAQAPSIVMPHLVEVPLDRPVSLTIETTGFPAATIVVDGDLPNGLHFTDRGDGTGVIVGTATGPGATHAVAIRVANVAGFSRQLLRVRIG